MVSRRDGILHTQIADLVENISKPLIHIGSDLQDLSFKRIMDASKTTLGPYESTSRTAQRMRILSLLVEGMSMRSIMRTQGVSRVTIVRLLEAACRACIRYHDDHVCGIPGKRSIQCDEVWSYVYAKQKRVDEVEPLDVAGDVWTWMAMNADSKLVVSYLLTQDRVRSPQRRYWRTW